MRSVRLKAAGYYNELEPETRNARVKQSQEKLRKKTIDFLGGRCVYCGCDDFEALEFNHKNGGGTKEYKQHHHNAYSMMRDVLKNKRTDIELVCRICNAHHYLTKIKNLKDRWTIVYK